MARWRGTDPSKWVGKVKSQNRALIRFSINRLADVAQTPGPSVAQGGANSKGGLLPVDQAFLRNSFASAIGQMPSGPSSLEEGDPGQWDGQALVLTLAQVQPGDVVFLGWTAKYARPMEARYGFMKAAAMGWQDHVDWAGRQVRAG